MTHPNLRTSLLALLIASSFPAAAASYYVVTPVPGKKVSNDAISVSLNATSAPAGQVGVPYAGFDLRSSLVVSGDPAYTGYGVKWQIVAGSLPAGLALNSNGTVTGTPGAAGSATFTVRATYKTKSGDQQYQVTTYRIDVSLASGTPPQALVGQPYGYNLVDLLTVAGDAAFNASNVVWSVVSSNLPAGLLLSSDGRIVGTPTAGGAGSITARATYKGMNGEQTYQVVSLNITVALAPATPSQALVGQPYAYNLVDLLTVAGDTAFNNSNVTWTVVSSSLPAGLYLSSDGRIIGTPTAGGAGNIMARATYKGVKGEQTYQVVSLNIAVALAPATPSQALVGQAYAYNLGDLLTVSGDSAFSAAAVTWSVVATTLPAGLYLASDGRIVGTPTAGGTGSITARATYKGVKGEQTYQVVSLNIAVALAAATLPSGVTGNSYSGFDFKTVASVTGDPAYAPSATTWALVSGALPTGLTLGSDGVVSGTPSAAATANFTLKASYKNKSDQRAYSMQVDAALVTGALAANSGADYGSVTVGGSANRTFTFTNNGNTSATGVQASASGPGMTITSSTCGTPGSPVSLAKGASCTVTARYAPTSAGAMTGAVAVNWSGPTASSTSLPITGTALVDYSSLMAGFTASPIAIPQNPAWAADSWYWTNADAQISAPVATIEFRRTITISGSAPVSAYLYGAVDNTFDALSVNGVLAYTDLGFYYSGNTNTPPITLQPGVNVISVQVSNLGSNPNPAGMAIQVRKADGTMLATEAGWMVRP